MTATASAPCAGRRGESLANNDRRPVYLNNAATAWPRAPGVVEAVADALRTPPAHPGRSGGRTPDVAAECRRLLAGLLGVSTPERLVLTVHATSALNLAIGGLDLRPGELVVTTVTEHNSVLRPLNHLQRDRGIRVTTVGLGEDGGLDVRAFEQALAEQPALVVVNHASNVTGRVTEVGPLFARARAAGAVTLLDASQSLGYIPVHAPALHADLVAFTGHKGLHGPPGTGGLYVTPGLELGQTFVGGTGVRSDLRLHPAEMPVRLEAGTPNLPALAGLAVALRWGTTDGRRLNANLQRVASRLRNGLRSLTGVTLFDDVPEAPRTGVVSFAVEGWRVDDVGCALEESFGIACRTGLHCAPLIHRAIGSAPHGTVRLSVSGFNSDQDVDAALEAVERIAR